MKRKGILAFIIYGLSFSMLIASVMMSTVASAADASGTWTSTVAGQGYTDDTWPAKFYYDAVLTIGGGTNTFVLTCSDVTINQPGWESASDMIGKSFPYEIDYSVIGDSITLYVPDGYGGSISLEAVITGNRMIGSGDYMDASYVTNSYTIDLTRNGGGPGGIGTFGLGTIAMAASIGGFLVGFATSLLPPPRFMGGSIMPPQPTQLGTPYAPSQSVVMNHQLSSMANQPQGSVTRPLQDVPRMRMQFDQMQFPNVEMGRPTDVRPTDVHPTNVLSTRQCPNCGSTLIATAAGWSCPSCNRAPPGGLDPQR